MIAKIGVRAVLMIAVMATIGCDRVTKHVARVALAVNRDGRIWPTRFGWSTSKTPVGS